jgi:hypothetical protein
MYLVLKEKCGKEEEIQKEKSILFFFFRRDINIEIFPKVFCH